METMFLLPDCPSVKNETNENLFTCSERIFSYVCLRCPNFRTDFLPRLTLHVKSNHNDRTPKYKKYPYRCPQCGYSTFSRFLLIRHCLLENKRQNCQLCDYKFTKTAQLSWHFFNKHLKPLRRKKQSPVKNIRPVQCEYCPYKVRWSCELKSHILAKHTPLEEIEWLHCDLCPSKFKLVKHLRQHVSDRHLKNKEVTWSQCDYCPYKCKRRSELKMHILRRHTSENEIHWHECDQCSYRTKERKRLNEHIALKHELRVKKFQCDFCEYKAMWCYELKRHMAAKHLSRDEIEWFVCDQCAYASKTKRGLREHVAIKHEHRRRKKNVEIK